jgi:glycosyltransferase XagB
VTTGPSRLGELLVDKALITPELLDYALQVQRQGEFRQRLGEILVQLGAATASEILKAVTDQLAGNRFSFRLGDLLVAKGLATRDQISMALDVQRVDGGRLGEILVARGVLTETKLLEVLERLHDAHVIRHAG